MIRACWNQPKGQLRGGERSGVPGGQMYARSERPSVASGVAERAAMAGGVSSVASTVDGGGIFSFYLTLPYLTLPYLTLPYLTLSRP